MMPLEDAADALRAANPTYKVAEYLALLQPREYYEAKPHKAPDDLERVRGALEALSSPPADDVREALVKELRQWAALIGTEPRGARELFTRAADALSEVRPCGTVTDTGALRAVLEHVAITACEFAASGIVTIGGRGGALEAAREARS